MLENHRIYLKPLCEDDFEFYRDINSNLTLMEYIEGTTDEFTSRKSFEIILSNMKLAPPKCLVYAIREKTNHQYLGFIGLKWNQKSTNNVELGTIILENFQKQRIAQQARSLLLNYAFNELDVVKVIGYCDVNNIAINKLNEKFGSIKEKIFFNTKRNRKEIKWVITQTNFDKANKLL
jgi:RimJ/RimL family protein N-acetyltransferase